MPDQVKLVRKSWNDHADDVTAAAVGLDVVDGALNFLNAMKSLN